MATAFIIDGAFFLRRFRWTFPHDDGSDPHIVAQALQFLCLWHFAPRMHATLMDHVEGSSRFPWVETAEFYRIFWYDCQPLTKRMHKPVSKTSIDFSMTREARFRLRLHDELRKVRKVAVRLGKLSEAFEWRLKRDALRRLIANPGISLEDDDFEIDTKQKGVDMRLGLDVAALAFKRQVNQIVLVAGDADFVPAVKLARREGIDVMLDPMGADPAVDLAQHVDGVRQCRKSAS